MPAEETNLNFNLNETIDIDKPLENLRIQSGAPYALLDTNTKSPELIRRDTLITKLATESKTLLKDHFLTYWEKNNSSR